MKVAAAWVILLTLPALAFMLHRHRPSVVRIGAAVAGLLAAPMAIGLFFDRSIVGGGVLVALLGVAFYAAAVALDQRNALRWQAMPLPAETLFALPETEPVTMAKRGKPELELAGSQPESLRYAEPAPLPPARDVAGPLDLAVTGWPDFSKDHPAEPSPPPVAPEPVAAAPVEPEPVAQPVKRGRGRPRKTAAKQASPSPVVKSEPVELLAAEPVGARSAEIDAAAVAAVEQAMLDPAPTPEPEKPAEPMADAWPVTVEREPEPVPPAVDLSPVSRSWHRPMVHAVPPEPFHLPQPSPVIAARTAAAGAVAAAPERPTASAFEQLLTRPAVIESLSPSGVVRIRIVGWPARILTAYRAAQLAMLLSVFLFYESILHFVGSKIGERIVPFLGGVWGGVFK